MTTPTVRHKGRGFMVEFGSLNTRGQATYGVFVTLTPSSQCPICGNQGHLLSDHVEEKVRGCQKCACIAQDTERA